MSENKTEQNTNLESYKSIFISLFVMTIFSYISYYYMTYIYTSTPYYDEWFTAPTAAAIAQEHWNFPYLFAREQGHPVFFYRLATIIDATAFSYTLKSTMTLGFFAMLSSAFYVAYTSYLREKNSQLSYVAAMTAVSATIFSLHNWENIIAPWIVNSSFLLLFFIITVYNVKSEKSYIFYISILSGLACTLAFGNGFLVWVCGAFILFLHKRNMRAVIFVILFIVAFVYMYSGRESLGNNINIFQAGLRMLTSVSSPVIFSADIISATKPISRGLEIAAMISGVAVFIFLILLFYVSRNDLDRVSEPLSMILFGLGSCALIAIGRSDLPPSQAISPRYFISAAPIFIGATLTILKMTPTSLLARFTLVIVSATIIAAYATALRAELSTAPYRKMAMQIWAQNVLNFQNATDSELANPHLPASRIRELAKMLSDANLGPFHRN